MKSSKHIFICGFSRAGTTMFYNMLRASQPAGYRFFQSEKSIKKVIGDNDEPSISKRPLDLFVDSSQRRIVMVRDPRAVITSRHWSDPDRYFISADKCIAGTPGLLESWQRLRQLQNEGQVDYLLKYEDLVASPNSPDFWQTDLAEKFELIYNGVRFSEFHTRPIPDGLQKPLNGVRPVDKGHDWKRHMARVREQFTLYPELFDMLIELGYEKDASWLL